MSRDRSKFLGGTDCASVLGVSPWATPMKTWRLKTGREVEVESPARAKLFRRGKLLEPVIIEMGCDRLREMGLDVEVLERNERYTDPEHPFISVEIDVELRLAGEVEINGERVAFDYEDVNGDAKSVGGFATKKWGEEGTDSMPIEYLAQFMTGLMVRRRRWCVAFAMMGIDDVGVYWVRRDETTIAAMRKKLVSFWHDHVLADVPPDPMVYDDITALFPMDDGTAVEASDAVAEMVTKLARVRAQVAHLAIEEEYLRFHIADFISPHARLTHKGKEIATWKGQATRRLQVDRLAKDHPNIIAEYMKDDTERVLRIPKKEKPA